MNNNVISVGCSWTYGLGIDSSQTYSAHLQKIFPEYKFINGGHCGADTDYAIFSGVKLIEKYKPKVLIFQITSLDRYTIGTDGFDNFINEVAPVTYNSNIYYESQDNNARLIGINNGVKTKYTQGSYTKNKKEINHEMKESCMNRVNLKKYKNFVDILYENIANSEYEYDKKINNLFLFKEYLKQKEIKSLWFFWAEPYNNKFFKNFFVNETYIDIHVTKWLSMHYPKKSYYIDSGYHTSSEGNKIIATDYISPKLEELL